MKGVCQTRTLSARRLDEAQDARGLEWRRVVISGPSSAGSSTSARSPIWYPNSASSPAPRTARQSAQDSRSFSCDGGTLRIQSGLSGRRSARTTPRRGEGRLAWKPGGGRLSTGCSRIEQCPGVAAQRQTDSPSPGAEDRGRRRAQRPLRRAASGATRHETSLEIPAYARQTYPPRPHSRHRSGSVLVPGDWDETSYVRRH